ncbi:electron transfer flavoprotein subunit alpha/FixB family protein [Parvularcula sp. LCG005]|uniref:electron transfer flavoprotein subunit alpha/FixB family protein n=1 Tax=Parvularcula sp. LCG005 TaxID=3078805 RepID=UPI00294212FD|nr:electron transfer flavoprotein subunit alpha/FixB family protein [Parvularcula sp. LCG005]WOI52096.1 electron transfer flavoprotein subunit alpha/FixB family protein [Parvularcula sp. LCG005]
MAILVIADHDNAALSDATGKTVTAAAKMGGDIDVLVAGTNAGDVANAAAKISGVRKVLHADDAVYEKQLAEPMAALAVSLADKYDAILTPAGTNGRNYMPRIAALLDVMQISAITGVESADTFVRPIYAGNALATVQSSDKIKIVTVQPTAFEAPSMDGSASVESVSKADFPNVSSFINEELTKSDRPELQGAKIVISGGRALGSTENFEKYIYPLADKMGAAVGASRAAVDAGYVPNDYQVGQTGKVVAPELYIAVGISGAIQHLAGMKDSKVIVAINKDEEAPIFQVADYGLVADLFEVLPKLQEAL